MKTNALSEMEAIVVSEPEIRPVLNPNTLEEDLHLSYDAEIQYKRKEPTVRLILCSSLDTVNVGETVMLRYHGGMRAYQHNRNVVTSNENNCFGGFYYTDGNEA